MNWQWLAMIGAGVIAALLFRRHVGFVTRVHAHSMSPTLRAGQLLFTRPLVHGLRLRHGDIAVVQSAELGQRVVKRVLGLPGDRLVFGSGGLVRNGEQLTEPYVVHAGGTGGSWRVPEGHCFLLGDNRAASSDSRSWKQPFAPLEAIVGRVCVGACSAIDLETGDRIRVQKLRGERTANSGWAGSASVGQWERDAGSCPEDPHRPQ